MANYKEILDFRTLLKQCAKCKDICDNRIQVVLPRGNPSSGLVFIGEAPGGMEAEKGQPFVGKAGAIFSSMIEALCLTEDDYYVTNVVKCRPTRLNPETGNIINRAPTDLEIQACGVWLKQEIELLKPKVIVLLGKSALRAFFGDTTKISNVAGDEIEGHILSQELGVRFFVMYHPSVLIYNEAYYMPLYKMGISNLKRLLKEVGIHGYEL